MTGSPACAAAKSVWQFFAAVGRRLLCLLCCITLGPSTTGSNAGRSTRASSSTSPRSNPTTAVYFLSCRQRSRLGVCRPAISSSASAIASRRVSVRHAACPMSAIALRRCATPGTSAMPTSAALSFGRIKARIVDRILARLREWDRRTAARRDAILLPLAALYSDASPSATAGPAT